MDYREALKWIHSREKFKVKPGLKRMEWLMERLDHPEKRIQAVHIAGTNGKGSTVSFLRYILNEQGYAVGTFTSPYIERFNERISVNGIPITDELLAELVEKIKPLAEELRLTPLGEPTEFEIITAMAMVHFSQINLDYVLVETGLGGTYDSTNIVKPLLSVITNIGHDHMNILGSTIEEIAGEKAGIIKPGIPVVTGVKQETARKVIQQKAYETGSTVHVLGDDFHVDHLESTAEGEWFTFSNGSFTSDDLWLSTMKGPHQVENAGVAVQAAEALRSIGVKVERSLYKDGIKKTKWPARFEMVRTSPLTIIDGAHNEEGTAALVETMKCHYQGRKVILVYAALEDKPVKKMMNALNEVVDHAFTTTFDFPRALSAQDLARLSSIDETTAVSNYKDALKCAAEAAGENGILLITGSLYFISKVRETLEE
ncbi:bifunctional folylpolyglutamate synthase/dihydrofolate synthase [Halobacillus litoralis]|uniref:bifunctional folylpolyglutamate synthase/dihydrofolate synthase n=1 Tax=Halobacillus litoralis TaxID=45668 RepID=UPI001CFCF64A|nr:folylpolyglutamate synthase/dihydrofolate synthase family protein [Halobacillus litoralis]